MGAMDKARLLFGQHQDALEANTPAKEAGAAAEASKAALKIAAQYKESETQITKLEQENKSELISNGMQWVSGPIFDKMAKLCDQDYTTFRKEYRKIRESPTYKAYRWDIKKACPKAHNDDGLETEEDAAATLAARERDALKNVHAPPPDQSKAYPHSNTHWSLPSGGQVKKWCTTQYGAVPCSMLKKAQRAGLLGDIKVDKATQKVLSMIQLDEEVSSFQDA